MSVALTHLPMTQPSFLDWVVHQEGRFEFDGFEPVNMTGGSQNHVDIICNISTAAGRRLRGGPCRVHTSEGPGVSTSGEKVRYPDVMVICMPRDPGNKLVQPTVVFEVISPESERRDRFQKPDDYHSVASIQRYVIVEQHFIAATVLFRDMSRQGTWSFQILQSGSVLNMPEVGISIPLDDFYIDVLPPLRSP